MLFTDKEYNSSDGFNVNFWGKMVWTILHTISFNYPVNPTEEDKDHYRDFLLSLRHVLPCRSCRENYARNLESIGFCRDDLANRHTFSMFIYRLHNCVNKMLGKKCVITYEDVRDRYEMFRARCLNNVPILDKHEKKNVKVKEVGCDAPLTGIKSKSVIHVVPIDQKTECFNIDPKCIPRRKK
jgi:hypothetical protein